ncbi:non-homologous end joining protein Ku [Streptomyces sp. NBC_00328]|uniref:non-homologous end joining protein Ku n=1 Tax=Streptomyces sp. NBC_00328 TaxID=2903646 RepID=UPI003FA70E4B
MRSIWNGAISFGLVSIPIKVMNATESHAISFRQIHLDDGGRIRYRKVCELEDSEVPTAEIGKAYEDVDGTLIPITDEDLASLPIPTTRTIEIVAFVPADRIDPLQMDTAYYLAANGVPAAKPYILLREALKRSQKVAVAKFALRGRERLGMLRVVDDVIAMHGLLWPDEIRATGEVAPDTAITVRDKELDMADALMDTLGEVDLEDLHDDYREAVEELVTAKAEGHEAPAAPSGEEAGGKVLDLMAALEKSVRAAKESRGDESEKATGTGEDAEVTELPSGKTRARESARTAPKEVGGKKSTSTAKKTAAKKTTPRKSTTKSTAGKKSTTGRQTTEGGRTESRTTKAKSAAGTAAKQSADTASSSSSASSSSRTAAKKTATKKTPARKSTPRKRASA